MTLKGLSGLTLTLLCKTAPGFAPGRKSHAHLKVTDTALPSLTP